MTDVGKLALGVTWNGDRVSATEIRSTRPMVSQLLKGKPPAQVLQIVPLLFSVCGKAQGAATGAALQAAQHGTAAISNAELARIVCEVLQEHLWRLLLDWPKLLGLPQQENDFRHWHALLRKISRGEVEMAVFLGEFERLCLTMMAADWRMLSDDQSLRNWLSAGQSPLARLLSTLNTLELRGRGMRAPRLLPAWSAVEAQQACAGNWDAAYAARPHWRGAAAETGAWSYYADSPLLRDVWRRSESKVLARLLARTIDVVALAQGDYAGRLDAGSPAAGEGIAVVRTARGLLLHRVRLEADRVADYTVIAPTEWNFHPEGAFAQDMRGHAAQNVEGLKQFANFEAMSLDPCVTYEVDIRNA
ncbi:MAG: nickel-dependent hydrogenase large subunit [Gallionella sp.]